MDRDLVHEMTEGLRQPNGPAFGVWSGLLASLTSFATFCAGPWTETEVFESVVL